MPMINMKAAVALCSAAGGVLGYDTVMSPRTESRYKRAEKMKENMQNYRQYITRFARLLQEENEWFFGDRLGSDEYEKFARAWDQTPRSYSVDILKELEKEHRVHEDQRIASWRIEQLAREAQDQREEEEHQTETKAKTNMQQKQDSEDEWRNKMIEFIHRCPRNYGLCLPLNFDKETFDALKQQAEKIKREEKHAEAFCCEWAKEIQKNENKDFWAKEVENATREYWWNKMVDVLNNEQMLWSAKAGFIEEYKHLFDENYQASEEDAYDDENGRAAGSAEGATQDDDNVTQC